MIPPNHQTGASHLHYRVQPFHLRSFRRILTFLPRGASALQSREFPTKREVLGLLSTDYFYRDGDVKFLNIGRRTEYKDTIMSVDSAAEFYERLEMEYNYHFSADQQEHAYYQILSDHKHTTLTYYGRFDTFLLGLVRCNSSQDIGESDYEYYLTVLRMFLSLADRLGDLLTIGFEISPIDPDIHARYDEAVYRACGVCESLRHEIDNIMWALLAKGLVLRKDIPDGRRPKTLPAYKVLKSEPVVNCGVTYQGVPPRDDPTICRHPPNLTEANVKTRLGGRSPSPVGFKAKKCLVKRLIMREAR